MSERVACMFDDVCSTFFVGRMFRFRSNILSNIQQMCKRVATLSTINTQINFQKNSYLKLTSRIERGHLKTKTTAHKRKY